jgi:hypothetical protein
VVGDPIALGDWDNDGVPDQYQSKVLSFEPAIGLMSATDRLELAHAENSLNQVAVVYLQAT